MNYTMTSENLRKTIQIANILAKKKASVLRLDTGRFEDMVQEGILRVLAASVRFDVTKAKFNTFANCHVAGAIADYLRYLDPLSRHDRLALNKDGYVLSDDGFDLSGCVTVDVESANYIVDNKSSELRMIEDIDSKIKTESLTDKEYVTACMTLQDFTNREIAEVLNVTESRLSQILTKVTNKLKLENGDKNEAFCRRRPKHKQKDNETPLHRSVQKYINARYGPHEDDSYADSDRD